MEQRFTQTIYALMERHPDSLSAMGAAILAAAHLGLSNDTRSFARKLGLAHALVLRECVSLADELKLIALEPSTDRSQRLFYHLTQDAHALLTEAA